MKKMKWFLKATVLVFLAFYLPILNSCKKDETPPVKINKIEFSETSVKMLLGDIKELEVIYTPSNLTKPDYNWVSSNSDIVSVDNGSLKANSVGKAKVTVEIKALNLFASVEVEVLPIAPESLTIVAEKNEIKVGEKIQLKYSINPPNTTDIDTKVVEWSSSDDKVINVNDKGELTAVGVGEAEVIATIKGTTIQGKLSIKILPIAPESLTIVAEKNEIKVGEKIQLKYSINPPNTTGIDTKVVEWSSSDDKVINVNNKGELTAVGVGTAEVIARIKGTTIQGKLSIKILKVDVQSISFDNNQIIYLEIGGSLILNYKILPLNATNKKVNWESKNTTVATVNQGAVKALTVGETEIKVVTEDGAKVATCKVVVIPVKVNDIQLDYSSRSILVGEKISLNVNVFPANALNRKVKWETSNFAVVTVDQEGNILAKMKGNAMITVTSIDNPSVTAVCYITVNDIDSGVSAFVSSSSLMNIGGIITGNVSVTLSNKGSLSILFKKFEIRDRNGVLVSQSSDSLVQTVNPWNNITLNTRLVNVIQPTAHYFFEINGRTFERVVSIGNN